jgi:hypothetical protein
MSRLGRYVRGLGLTRNPLRRQSDKIEARSMLVMIGFVLVVGPLLALDVGAGAYRAGIETERAQAGYTQVRAHLIGDAGSALNDSAAAVPDTVLAEAMWTAPSGSVRTAQVPVRGGMTAGTPVTIWVDQRGWKVGPPRQHSQTVALAVTLAALVPLAMLAGVAVARRILRRALDARRLAQWQYEWLLVEPRWSGRVR